MKKVLLPIFMSAVLVLSSACVSTSDNGDALTENSASSAEPKEVYRETIVNKEEIKKMVEQSNLPFEPEDVVEITTVYFDTPEVYGNAEGSYEENSEIGTESLHLGNDYYLKCLSVREYDADTYTNKVVLSAPGEVTAALELETSVSAGVELSAEVISADIGVDITQKITLSATEPIEVPEGEIRVCYIFPAYREYVFEIYEDDLFLDDFVGVGSVVIPIGMKFVIAKKATTITPVG